MRKIIAYIRIHSWLVGFYGKSTPVGYLIPNPIYTYIINMICKHIL